MADPDAPWRKVGLWKCLKMLNFLSPHAPKSCPKFFFGGGIQKCSKLKTSIFAHVQKFREGSVTYCYFSVFTRSSSMIPPSNLRKIKWVIWDFIYTEQLLMLLELLKIVTHFNSRVPYFQTLPLFPRWFGLPFL